MRSSFLTTGALCLALLVAITVGPAAGADKKAKKGQLNGTAHMINKETSTITVQKGSSPGRQVVYNADTKWLYGTQSSNKPSSLDQLKENWYINCTGTFDGVKLVATACRFRESK